MKTIDPKYTVLICMHCGLSLDDAAGGACDALAGPEHHWHWVNDNQVKMIDEKVMMHITSEQLDVIAKLSNKCDDLMFVSRMKAIAPEIHVIGLAGGLEETRDRLRALYREISGNDPWAEP